MSASSTGRAAGWTVASCRDSSRAPEIIRTILDAGETKILLPVNRFRMEVAGTESSKLEQLITHSLGRVRALLLVGSSS